MSINLRILFILRYPLPMQSKKFWNHSLKCVACIPICVPGVNSSGATVAFAPDGSRSRPVKLILFAHGIRSDAIRPLWRKRWSEGLKCPKLVLFYSLFSKGVMYCMDPTALSSEKRIFFWVNLVTISGCSLSAFWDAPRHEWPSHRLPPLRALTWTPCIYARQLHRRAWEK